jgi:hypothetical protein
MKKKAANPQTLPQPPDTAKLVAAAPLAPARHGDRGNADDAAEPALRRWIRYRDLEAAGIVQNWTTLNFLIDEQGFPPGILLGRNTRCWDLSLVKAWLASRPTERKAIPIRRRAKQQQAEAS